MKRGSRSSHLRSLFKAVLLAGVVAVTGCGDQPDVDTFSPDAQLNFVRFPVEPGVLGTASGPISQTFTFDGDVGGTFSFHHMTLTFPPGAVDGVRELSITVDDPTIAIWDLHISGLNDFAVPVTATVDYSAASFSASHDMLWFDEAAGVWVDLGALDALNTGQISVQLQHFSIYGVIEGTTDWN